MAKDSNQLIIQLITNPSFREWCVGNAMEKQSQHWEQWISKHADCTDDILSAKKIVIELEDSPSPKSPPYHKKYDGWERLQKRMAIPHHYENSASSSVALHPSFGWILTAAATVLLVIATLFTIEYTDFITIPSSENDKVQVPSLLSTTTDYGEQKVITLDDDTRITLNANSSVTYHDGWVYKDTVEVRLDGEAFFDVTPRALGKGPVFQVQTADGNIHVLGTRFMVNTWDETTKVVLEEGKVAIQRKGVLHKNEETIIEPSEMAVFTYSASDVTIQNVKTRLYTSWTKGLFEFERAPITLVADRIEKLFGKEVVITDPMLMGKKVSGAVENDNLDVLLSTLSSTLEISIVEYEDQIVFRQNMLKGSYVNQTLN